MKKTISTLLLLTVTATAASAGQIGHYAGGLMNIRDFFVPEPGFYGVMYNYYYLTGRLNDPKGHQLGSVNVNPGPGPGAELSIEPDVGVYMLAPAFIWSTDYKVLGANFAAFIAPNFANASVGASVETEESQGIDSDTSQFGLGDWFFQPIWLGWHLEHYDFSLGYGFYAPTGKYDTDLVTFPNFPNVGPIRVASADNIGYGFWTNQFQGAAAWYPWVNKATAVTLALTYEIHSEKEGFDLTPGQDLSLNWGISQYLPLTKDQKWLVEIGPAGYDQFQVTSDDGQNATNNILDQVHAAGAQLGVTSVEYLAALNFHYFNEYESQDRFEGHVFGLSASKKF